ncbi:MAG TPA: hypothetical protein VIQ02_11665, partial [Jiangellaceae bacterium]
MSDVPFGFRPGDDPERSDDDAEGVPAQRSSGEPADHEKPEGPQDPLSQLFEALGAGGAGAPDIGAMLQQIGRMLSWTGGPVNWDLANQSARQVVAAGGDKSVSAVERRAVEDAFRL